MRNQIAYLLLPLVLLGCFKSQADSPTPAPAAPSARTNELTDARAHFVQTADDKDQKQIKGQAVAMLAAHDYDGLEALAAKYRASKEEYTGGMWKLSYFYVGVDSPEGDDAEWQRRLKELQDWQQHKPDAITPVVALGRFWDNYAWHARGGGFADTVTDENARLMMERLHKAAEVMRMAEKIKQRCPLIWTTLQRIALGSGWDKSTYDKLFERAIAEFPDYQPYYTQRAMYLLPRWYGDQGEWLRDLTIRADRVGGENGDIIYAQTVWCMHYYSVYSEPVKPSWERIDRGFAAILKRHPDSLAAKNQRACLAALAGAREKARKYFSDLNGEVDPDAWSNLQNYQRAYKWAFSTN